MNLGLRFLLVAIFVLVVVPSATADTISIGGPWLEFAYADSGTPAFGCDGACVPSSGGDSIEAGDPAGTFTSTVPVTVTITDAFFSGNSFELFDGSTLIGSTPSVDIGYSSCGSDADGSDPAACSMDPNFSSGVFSLGAGDHSLTIDALDSPFGGGAAYFSVDSAAAPSPVPEPTTALLVLSGALALLWHLDETQLGREPQSQGNIRL